MFKFKPVISFQIYYIHISDIPLLQLDQVLEEKI